MLPNAQTDCSATLFDGDFSKLTNFGTAPALATVTVCSDVPDAMLVNAHAASNCKSVLFKEKQKEKPYLFLCVPIEDFQYSK